MAAHVPRVYLPQSLTIGQTLTMPDAKRHHLATVLRVSAGDQVTLFNDGQYEYRARIERATRKTLEATVIDRAATGGESGLSITLLQSILASDRMDYALAKAVELGVAHIQPVFAENAKIKLAGERLAKKHAHWQAVVEAAAEQSGRLVRPEVGAPVALAEIWSSWPAGIVLALRGRRPLASRAVDQYVNLAIGPESGLSDREIDDAHAHGWHSATLGPRVLRAETAGPAAITALQTLAGDFSAQPVTKAAQDRPTE